MSEEQNQSVNTEDVAEPQTDDQQDTSVENSDVADPKPVQDDETNAHFADKRRKQELDQYKQQSSFLDKLAKMSGYDNTDAFIQAVEEAEKQKEVQKQAEQMGIDEKTYQEYFQPVNQEVETLKSELSTLKQQEAQRQIETELSQLKGKYEDFEQYQDKVFEMVLQGEVKNLEKAYLLASYEDKINSIGKEKEQEVLAKVTGRDEKQVLSSQDKPTDTKFTPSNMSFEEIEKLSERVRRGEKITF